MFRLVLWNNCMKIVLVESVLLDEVDDVWVAELGQELRLVHRLGVRLLRAGLVLARREHGLHHEQLCRRGLFD